jgi:hypothetical protein
VIGKDFDGSTSEQPCTGQKRRRDDTSDDDQDCDDVLAGVGLFVDDILHRLHKIQPAVNYLRFCEALHRHSLFYGHLIAAADVQDLVKKVGMPEVVAKFFHQKVTDMALLLYRTAKRARREEQ